MSFIEEIINVIFIEKRLPHRVDKFLNDLLYKRKTEKVLRKVLFTNPVRLGTKPAVDVRMLVCKKDFIMAILCLKSFIRYYNNCTVHIHDDGSLDENAIHLIESHIIGSQVIRARDSNEWFRSKERNLYDKRELAKKMFKIMPITVHKLFDLYYMSDANKVILLDSDILFLRKPAKVINWIIDEHTLSNMYAQPYLKNLIIKNETIKLLFPGHDIIEKFNSGLLCVDKRLISSDLILEVLDKVQSDHHIRILGDECIWRLVFSHTKSFNFPFEEYPLFVHPKYFKKFLREKHNFNYIHFLLKHKGGFYRKYAHEVIADLTRE